MDFKEFGLVHSQLLQQIPAVYWKALHRKLTDEVYDAGQHFMMSPVAPSEGVTRGRYKAVTATEQGVSKEDPNCIFLVDHAWTYELTEVKQHLMQVPGLADRMASMMSAGTDGDDDDDDDGDGDGDESIHKAFKKKIQIHEHTDKEKESTLEDLDRGDQVENKLEKSAKEEEDKVEIAKDSAASQDSKIDYILKEIWKFNGNYSITSAATLEERAPLWYVLDEFGSSIQHSEQPSCRMVPFLYVNRGVAYNVLWPIRDLEYGEAVTVDYAASADSLLMRAILMLPWQPESLTLDSPLWKEMPKYQVPPVQPRGGETWPPQDQQNGRHLSEPASLIPPLKVYTDMEVVRKHLKCPSFQLVDSPAEANILWLFGHYKDFRSLPRDKFVNQFPCEMVITCKDLLLTVAQRAARDADLPLPLPPWVPLSVNLFYQLPQVLRECLKRKAQGGPSVWIVKPWNMGRSLDTVVIDDVAALVRLSSASPRVACEYLCNPVLFYRDDLKSDVKFDFRYMLLLKSVQPLELYVYRIFWLRFGNKPYSLDDLTDRDVHFTVMNYRPEAKLKQIHYNDFVPLFERQYPDYPWKEIEDEVFDVFRQFFKSAVSAPPPAGIAHCSQSRAIYACDLMLNWESDQGVCGGPNKKPKMVPKVLEMNYCPDCDRACLYHPFFFDHMFSVLFLQPEQWGEQGSIPVTRLL